MTLRRAAESAETTSPELDSELNRLRTEDASVAEFVAAGGLTSFRPLSEVVR